MAVQVKASYKLTGWNSNQLRLRASNVLSAYDKVIFPQFKEEIKAIQFPWPRETKRYGKLLRTTNLKKRAGIREAQGGKPYSLARSPRDIVDSGMFINSQERIRGVGSRLELRYRWDAPYASLILTGYSTSKGTIVPGRNWIKPALDAIPLDKFFAAEWRKLAKTGL